MSAPRWTRWLLGRAAPPGRVDEVLGDLEEAHRARRERRGAAVAALLTALEALDMALALVHQRARARSTFSLLDFKLGFRMLLRYPGLTLVGGLSMALAIGLGAAAFEAINEVLSPALPFPEGDRIVAIRNWDPTANRAQPRVSRDLAMWREELESVGDLGAFRVVERNLITEQGEAAPIELAEISASAFVVTGATPLLGRLLGVEDEREGAPPVLVIGEDVWEARFGRDPGVVGRTVRLGISPATIVGVAPSDVLFPMGQTVWAPLPAEALRHDWGEGPAISVFGRLVPGVTLASARAEVAALGARLAAALPATHEHLELQIERYPVMHLPIQCGGVSLSRCLTVVRAGLYGSNLLFVAFLALIFANVALLMFARAATREAEIVVRTALGASRGRIVAQLVAEALALGAVASVVGLGAAGYALGIAQGLLEHVGGLPFWWDAGLSLPSVGYAVGLTLLGATIAGALPGLKLTKGRRVHVGGTAAGAGGIRFGRAWTAVIVGQVALTVFAVAMTAYIVQLTARIASFDLGVPADEYVAVRLERDDGLSAELFAELERRLVAEPAVRGVTFASRVPGSYHGRVRVEVDGVDGPRWVQPASVDPGFYDVLGLGAVSGRLLESVDVESEQRVVVVNEAFAERVLSGRNAVGRRLRFQVSEDPADPWGEWHEIVGVAEQVAMTADPEMPPAGVYRPLARGGTPAIEMAVHVAGDAASFVPQIRRLASAVDPTLRLDRARTLEGDRDAEAGWYGTWTRVALGASLVVLALSLAGIYSIASFTVSRRTREIGIRVALGADRRRVVAPIVARPMKQVALGVGLGVGSLVLFGAMDSGALGPRFAVLAAAFTVVMFGICMLACVVPTRRALRIEPTEALRADG